MLPLLGPAPAFPGTWKTGIEGVGFIPYGRRAVCGRGAAEIVNLAPLGRNR